MLKTYAVGLLGGLVLALAVAGVYVATEPKQEAGLLWGGIVYDSKQEFNGYLKSKGLSYKVWLQRNPGVAPWEPNVQASAEPATDPSPSRLPLAVHRSHAGDRLLAPARLAAGPPVLARVPTAIGALPSPRPRAKGSGRDFPSGASLRRLGVLASSAVRSVEAAVPRYSGRPGGGRVAEARLLPGFPSERNLRLGDLALRRARGGRRGDVRAVRRRPLHGVGDSSSRRDVRRGPRAPGTGACGPPSHELRNHDREGDVVARHPHVVPQDEGAHLEPVFRAGIAGDETSTRAVPRSSSTPSPARRALAGYLG